MRRRTRCTCEREPISGDGDAPAPLLAPALNHPSAGFRAVPPQEAVRAPALQPVGLPRPLGHRDDGRVRLLLGRRRRADDALHGGGRQVKFERNICGRERENAYEWSANE